MSRSHYSSARTPSPSARGRMRSFSPKHKSYDSRSDDAFSRMSSSKYPHTDSYRRKPSSTGESRLPKYDKIHKYSSYDKDDDRYDKYDRYDKFASKYDKLEKSSSRYDKLEYSKYDSSYDKKDKISASYNGSDKYRSYRSPQKSPLSYSDPSRRYDSPRYTKSPKDPSYSRSYGSKSHKSSYFDTSTYKSSKDFLPPYEPAKSRHSTKDVAKIRDSRSYGLDKDLYSPSFSGTSKRSRDPYDKMGPPKKSLIDPRYDRYDKPIKDPYSSSSSKYPAINNNSYERYVIGNSVVYGSPGHDPEALYSPTKSRSHRKKTRGYSPYPSMPDDLRVLDRVDMVSRTPYTSDHKGRPQRGRMRSPLPHRNSYSLGKESKGRLSGRRLTGRPSGKRPAIPANRRRSANMPRPTSPPKPLLSINLSASSIGLSRHRVKQTLTIDEDPARRRRPPVRLRRDDARPKSSRSQSNRRPGDLRLLIESRKSSNGKRRQMDDSRASRSARLSAAVNKVRLLESKRRAAAKAKGPLSSRLSKGKLSRSSIKSKTSNKERKEMPVKQEPEDAPETPPRSPTPQSNPPSSPKIKTEPENDDVTNVALADTDVEMPSEEE